jgi:hypothetical protein
VKVAARTLGLAREQPQDLEAGRITEAVEHGRKRELSPSRMRRLAHTLSLALLDASMIVQMICSAGS